MTATSNPNDYPARPRDVAAPSQQATIPRRVTGVLRIAAGLLVLAAITTQIVDLVVNDAFEPQEYFSYFTIQSSLVNIVVLAAGGLLAMRWRADPELFTAVRMTTVTYAVVTAVVYNLLLRGLPTDDFVGVQWPNEVTHVWIPIVIALDWVLSPGRAVLAWGRLWLAIGYPLLWLGFTLVRGVLTGWYPYPFLDPDGPNGPVSVIAYIVGITLFILAVACVAIGISRVRTRTEPAG
jgi:hypothetical protein